MQTAKFLWAGLVLAAFSATGCTGLGKALGDGKNPPDEFAIATKAPLVVPPDYALRHPSPANHARRNSRPRNARVRSCLATSPPSRRRPANRRCCKTPAQRSPTPISAPSSRRKMAGAPTKTAASPTS